MKHQWHNFSKHSFFASWLHWMSISTLINMVGCTRTHGFEILSWFFNGVVHRWHINIPSRWRLRGSPLFRIHNTCTHADEHHYKVPSHPTVQGHDSISSRESHGTGGPRRVRCPSIGLCIIIVQCNMWFHWMDWGGKWGRGRGEFTQFGKLLTCIHSSLHL